MLNAAALSTARARLLINSETSVTRDTYVIDAVTSISASNQNFNRGQVSFDPSPANNEETIRSDYHQDGSSFQYFRQNQISVSFF